jgi:hypothetical protein
VLGEPHRGKAIGSTGQDGDDHVDEGDPVGEVRSEGDDTAGSFYLFELDHLKNVHNDITAERKSRMWFSKMNECPLNVKY